MHSLFYFLVLGLHLEVPRLELESELQSELQFPAYVTATTPDLSHASVTYTTAWGKAESLTN